MTRRARFLSLALSEVCLVSGGIHLTANLQRESCVCYDDLADEQIVEFARLVIGLQRNTSSTRQEFRES